MGAERKWSVHRQTDAIDPKQTFAIYHADSRVSEYAAPGSSRIVDRYRRTLCSLLLRSDFGECSTACSGPRITMSTMRTHAPLAEQDEDALMGALAGVNRAGHRLQGLLLSAPIKVSSGRTCILDRLHSWRRRIALVYAPNSFKLSSGATVSSFFARKGAGSMASETNCSESSSTLIRA